MTRRRRTFTAEQKADTVRRHLQDKVPVSDLAEELELQPSQIHQWVAAVLAQAEKAFAKTAKQDKRREAVFRHRILRALMSACDKLFADTRTAIAPHISVAVNLLDFVDENAMML